MNTQSKLILAMLTSAGLVSPASAQMVIGQKATTTVIPTVIPKTVVVEKPMATAVLPVLAPAKPVMLATPISPAIRVQVETPKVLNLGDMKQGIAGGNSSGSGATPQTIPGSGGMYRAAKEETKERSKEAPAGSLASGGKEAQRAALENERGREISASELVKTHQQRTLDGLKAAAAPQGGMDGKEVTDRSGARTNPLAGQGGNSLERARGMTSVDADAGKNATNKRAQQSDVNATTEQRRAEDKTQRDADNEASRNAIAEREREKTSTVGYAYDKRGIGGVLTWGWARVERAAASEDKYKPTPGVTVVGVRGTPNPEDAAGDGGPVPWAVGMVDRQPRTFSESRAALKRQVTLPGEGTGSTEKVYVNPGEAAKAVMGARQQNLINPSREESTVTTGPLAGNSAGQSGTKGNPVPSGGGGTNPDGGSGDPFCPTCRN